MRFWTLYAEYANSHAVEVAKYGSDRIQQMIAEFAIQKPDHDNDFPFQKMLDFLEEHMNGTSAPHPFSSTGTGSVVLTFFHIVLFCWDVFTVIWWRRILLNPCVHLS